MAETTFTDRVSDWNASIEKLNELTLNLAQCPPQERRAVERAIAEQEDDLLDTPAPSLDAVITKLELLWDGQLFGIDPETEQRRLILDDLADLIVQGAQLFGIASDARDGPKLERSPTAG